MKNYKILKNRPELTNEQVIEDMDFNKIKNNAALAKSALLKSIFIKGLLGIVIISSTVLIYKNYNSSITKKTKVIFADTIKIISRPEKDTSVDYLKTIRDKNPASIVEHNTTVNNTGVAPPVASVTNAINSSTVNNREIKERIHTNGNYDYSADEKQNPDNLKLFTALGQVDIKEINKSFAKINERLYASKYEVSNELYMTFLNSLRQSANAKLVSVAEIDTLKWRDKLSYNEPYVHYYHTHPAYQNYPVVNITYEGAKLFCEWLTVQYNSDPKREFKKVCFRLPSEKEWIIAAQAGDSSAIYPWNGREMRNKKGQIMANFKMEIKDELVIDGKHVGFGDITTPVRSYWENNFGLYNMSGNVAEMINEKGIVKGGSWRDIPEYLEINANYTYDGSAQAFVGFRYFVEILEQ